MKLLTTFGKVPPGSKLEEIRTSVLAEDNGDSVISHSIRGIRTVLGWTSNPSTRVALRLTLTASTSSRMGPGSGFFSVALAKKVAEGRLALIDVQSEMVRWARRRLRGTAVANTEFVVGDVERLPYKNHSFDCAILIAVLGEVRHPELCVKELWRVLVCGGFLVIHEHLPDPDWLRLRTLRALVEKQPFSLVRKWGKPWNYTAVFQSGVELHRPNGTPATVKWDRGSPTGLGSFKRST